MNNNEKKEELLEEEIKTINEEIISEENEKEEIEEISYDDPIIKVDDQNKEPYEEVNTTEINNVIEEPKSIEKIEEQKPKTEDNNKKEVYIDFKLRLIGYTLTFITLFVLTIIFLQGTFSTEASKLINYNENSNLDYKVYLKANEFYETNYLGKNKVYVASLIDNVEISFKYNYNIEKPSDVDFNYSIVAKLTIDDGTSKNNYFEKEYVLLSNKVASIKEGTNYNLNEKVIIDYDYYNSLANSFKQQYGVDTTSNLTVYLKVNKKSDIENANNSIENSTMFVKIPLSEKSVNIELNYQDINNSNYIIQENDSKLDNIVFGILSLISLAATLIFTVQLIRLLTLLRGKKSAYDKYINKILNEYDRLIVENGTGPDTKTTNVIKISQFDELLDVRDNLKLPIMYYVIAKHTKCCFYIKHNRDLYLMVVKAVDLEEENK